MVRAKIGMPLNATESTAKSVLLCLTCVSSDTTKFIAPDQPVAGDAETRMYAWQLRTSRFWAEHPAYFRFLKTSQLWLIIAIFAAFVPNTREYAVYPMIIAVLISVLGEHIPLRPLPVDIYNTVTSARGKFMCAAMLVIAATVTLLVYSGVIALSECFGNATFSRYSPARPAKYMWTDGSALVSSWLVIAPIVYISSLSVSERFVEKVDALGTNYGA